MLASAVLAGIVAAAIMLALGFPWRAPSPWRVAVAWPLAAWVGMLVGVWLLDGSIVWPPSAASDRYLLVLLPLVIGAEAIAAAPRVPGVFGGLSRLVLAAVVGVIVVPGYLAQLKPNALTWHVAIAAVTAATWWHLRALEVCANRRTVPLIVGLVVGFSAAAVLLNHTTSGGRGVPLSGAIIGAVVASLALKAGMRSSSAMGAVGLVGLLVIGVFAAETPKWQAAVMLGAPVLAWAPELPVASSWRPAWRETIRIALVIVGPAVVVALDYAEFAQESSLGY